MLFNEYPYTNLTDINLDWIIAIIKKLRNDIDDFVNINTIKYANPIEWDITRQYEMNTVVVDELDGTAYLSVRPVPTGVIITNTNYWTPIFNYGEALEVLRDQITIGNERRSATATRAYLKGALIFFEHKLYQAMTNIPIGTAFVVNENIEKVTVESWVNSIVSDTAEDLREYLISYVNSQIEAEATAREGADSALGMRIDDEIQAREDADSALGDRITEEISDVNDRVDAVENATIAPDKSICSVINGEMVRCEPAYHYYLNSTPGSAIYGAFMGFCSTPDHRFVAQKYPIEAYYNFGDHTSDLCTLTEYDAGFHVIRTSDPILMYHGACMYFHDGKIYATAGSSNGVAVQKIIVINYSTLTKEREITINDNANFIWFDDTNMYTGTVHHIEKRNIDGSLVSSTAVDLPYYTHSIKPYGDYFIGSASNDSELFVMDKNYNILKFITISPTIKTAKYTELKDIAINGDDIYLLSNPRSYYRASNGEATECYARIIHTNLYKNVAEKPFFNISYAYHDTVYVDDQTTNTVQDGTSSNPFKTLMQAINSGYRNIVLVHSGGLYLFGCVDVSIDTNTVNNVIYLGPVSNSLIRANRGTFRNGVIYNTVLNSILLFGDNVSLPDKLNTDSCIINSGSAAVKLNESNMSILSTLPAETNLSEQKWYYSANSNAVTVPFNSWPVRGGFVVNIKIEYGGNVYRVMIAAPNYVFLNNYVSGFARSGGANHTLIGYVGLLISDGTITATLQNVTVDGADASTATVTQLSIEHII